MEFKTILAAVVVISLAGAGIAYAKFTEQRTPVEFYKGHSHDHDGNATGAPAHSGGTDRYGCHNASVPYHCH